jgi:hypothetical protein
VDHIRMDLVEMGWRIGTGEEFLWIRYWTFEFHKMLGNYRVSKELGISRVVLSSMELLRKYSSGLENREYGRRDPSFWPRDTLYPQKLVLTSFGRYSSLADWGHIVFLFSGEGRRHPQKGLNLRHCRGLTSPKASVLT